MIRIDFIQGRRNSNYFGDVLHTINQVEIITWATSADKMSGTSYFTYEPKRLTFSVFSDTWINDNILSGDYENIKYISHYEVECYNDSTLIFKGIIDASTLNHDEATDIVKFTCYDKLRLLKIFEETEYTFSTGDCTPVNLVATFCSEIESQIMTSAPYSSLLVNPVCNETSLSIYSLNYNHVIETYTGDDYIFTETAESFPSYIAKYIVDYNTGVITFVFFHQKVYKYEDVNGVTDFYSYKSMAKIVKFYNGICKYIVDEYKDQSDWTTDNSDFDERAANLIQFLLDNEIPYYSLSYWQESATFNNNSYNVSTANNYLSCLFTGNIIPDYMQFGEVDNTSGYVKVKILEALKAVTFIYNAVIYDDSGTICINNRTGFAGSTIALDNADVIQVSKKRADRPKFDPELLSVITGDTAVMVERIFNYLTGEFESKWEYSITLDNLSKYCINVYSIIGYGVKQIGVTKVKRDRIKDEYIITGWLLDA